MSSPLNTNTVMNDGERYLLAEIVKHLPSEPKKPPLVIGVELVWTRKLEDSRAFGTLILTTARHLTTNGGDGWTGFDDADSEEVAAAVEVALYRTGAAGLVDRFVIRA